MLLAFQQIIKIYFQNLSSMGKNQPQSDQTIKTKNESLKKKKPGRPSNIQIQTQFMNIIRDTKLQAINAQTELQLEMAFFTTQDEKKSRRKQQSSMQDRKQKIFQYTLLTTDQKLNLVQFFEHQKANWKFTEIQEVSELPQYFFDDQHDLSFMLYRLIRSRREQSKNDSQYEKAQNKQNSKKVRAEELFFMALLCLNSQQTLRDAVVQFLLKNQDLILNLLRASMQKSKQKYKQKIEKKSQLQNQDAQNLQLGANDQSNNFDDSNGQVSALGKIKGKSKKIQKTGKKQTKSKKVESQSQDEPILTQKQKQEKLIMCFVNFTIWSYFYVYPQQEKPIENFSSSQNKDMQ